MRIAIGSDHRGFTLKTHLIKILNQATHEVVDVGTDSDQSVDYPDVAAAVGEHVSQQQVERGILICGTGIGMSITANKLPGVRAAPCHNVETAEISRRHNDLNVLCLAASGDHLETTAEEIVQIWLNTPFEAGRHARRLKKITALEDAKAVSPPADPSSSC
ncbi:MAG: ribose 5-phosphate isomerase B [Pirellulaceae bacterium]